MDFEVNADLVPLFEGLIAGLKPYARAQDVTLGFASKLDELIATYNPEKVLAEITVLLSRVITFTPQSFSVLVTLEPCSTNSLNCFLIVENTGVNLSKLGEIIISISRGLTIEEKVKGTRFFVEIPVAKTSAIIQTKYKIDLLPKQYPQYYSEIHKRLTNHFDNIESIQAIADSRGLEQGVFMKKVNAIIKSNLGNEYFSVNDLANAMALSRAQLFRKVKNLTQMSPSVYLKFTRLQEAKRLLQSKNEDLNVSEVCFKVGFASISHFTRSFKKQFGMNPSSLVT